MGEEKKELIKKKSIKKVKKMYIIFAIILISVIAIDQITKICAINIGTNELIPGILKINISENKSGAYGIGSDSSIMYIITNLIVIAVLIKFLTSQNDFISTKIKLFISLIVAGGSSNIIDRICKGYVVEFIEIQGLPIFNIADIFILIGWIAFIAIFASFTVKEMRANKTKKNIKFEDNDIKKDIKKE